MALIKCEECGREISSAATNCPYCGAPIKSKKAGMSSMIYMIIFIIIGAALEIAAEVIFWETYRPSEELLTLLYILGGVAFVIAIVFLVKMILEKRR